MDAPSCRPWAAVEGRPIEWHKTAQQELPKCWSRGWMVQAAPPGQLARPSGRLSWPSPASQPASQLSACPAQPGVLPGEISLQAPLFLGASIPRASHLPLSSCAYGFKEFLRGCLVCIRHIHFIVIRTCLLPQGAPTSPMAFSWSTWLLRS